MENLILCKSTVNRDGIHFNDEGDLIIPVRSIPFGNEKSTDLDQQFFDKDTYLGDWKEHLVFFDHDDEWLPEKFRYGKRPIGKSFVTHTDDSGVFEKLVIDRRTRFIKSIHDLFKAGVLDISTVAEWGSLDPNIKGRIAEWGWKRTDVTATNSDARATLAKSFSGELQMPEEDKDKKEGGTEGGEEKKEEKQEEKSETKIQDRIQSIFKQAEEDAKKELESAGQNQEQINSVLEVVKSGFATVTAKMDELQKGASIVTALQEQVKDLSGKMTDIEMGLDEFAKSVANRIYARTAEDLQKSEAERRAESELRKAAELKKSAGDQSVAYGKLPKGAPGTEKH